MKVTIFAPGFPPWSIGGEEYYAYYQARELAKLGHEVYIVANGTENSSSTKIDNASSSGIQITLVRSIRVKNDILRYAIIAIKFLFSFLKLRIKPNVIHGHDPYGEGLAALIVAKILRARVAITWHAAELVEKGTHFSFVGNACRRFVLKYADCVIVNSEFFKKMVVETLRDDRLKSKIYVLSPCVDAEEFHPRRSKSHIRSKYGISDSLVVLSVCRLEKIKGLDVLIKSVPLIVGSFPNVMFIIVGSGSERQYLEELAEKLNVKNKVIFAESVSRTELPLYYLACDVFVVPTRGEGFGMSFLEAWSCGKPIIVTPYAPEIASIVRKYGGGLIALDDPEHLSNALTILLSNEALRIQMGKIGRKIAVGKYSWMEMIRRHIEIYEKLCGD